MDANVLSEATKPDPDARVMSWLSGNSTRLYVTPIVLGESEYGILLLPQGKKRRRLESWLAVAQGRFPVLDFDFSCATAWARLLARLKKTGRAMPIKDSLIAASALVHKLAVATRNTKDFTTAGVDVVNPFEADGE